MNNNGTMKDIDGESEHIQQNLYWYLNELIADIY